MTGAATRAVRKDIARNPPKSAAKASDRPSANGRARQDQATAANSVVSRAGSQSTGSRSAARLSATPPIAATGIQRKNRRSSASRASASAKAPRQSSRHSEMRVSPAAAEKMPMCERDVMPLSQPYVAFGKNLEFEASRVLKSYRAYKEDPSAMPAWQQEFDDSGGPPAKFRREEPLTRKEFHRWTSMRG